MQNWLTIYIDRKAVSFLVTCSRALPHDLVIPITANCQLDEDNIRIVNGKQLSYLNNSKKKVEYANVLTIGKCRPRMHKIIRVSVLAFFKNELHFFNLKQKSLDESPSV